MGPDYFKEYQTFVLYAIDTAGWTFAVDREALYVLHQGHESSRTTKAVYACT